MGKIKLNDLKKAGKELNELLFDKSTPMDEKIDIKADEEALKEKIMEAAELVEDEEFEDLSETTQNVINELKESVVEDDDDDDDEPAKPTKTAPKKPVVEDTDDDTDEPAKPESKKSADEQGLAELIMDAGDLDELKSHVKSNELFKDLRRGMGIEKNIERLRAKMLAILGADMKVVHSSPKAAPEKKVERVKKTSSRIEVMTEVIRDNPGKQKDWLVKLADEKFCNANGASSNLKEQEGQYQRVIKVIAVLGWKN